MSIDTQAQALATCTRCGQLIELTSTGQWVTSEWPKGLATCGGMVKKPHVPNTAPAAKVCCDNGNFGEAHDCKKSPPLGEQIRQFMEAIPAPAERPAHTPLPPLYLGDHEHKFMCATDEQQCDGECKASHRCSVCHKRNDKLGWPSRLTPLQIREAQLRTACNNYEALKLSHAALMKALRDVRATLSEYRTNLRGKAVRCERDCNCDRCCSRILIDRTLANAKALEGL